MNPMLTLIRTALEAVHRPGARRAALAVLFPMLALEPARAAVRRPRALARVVAVAVLAAGALAVAGTAAVEAREYLPFSVTRVADGRLVDVRVLVAGEAAPLYLRDGQWDRRYVQAFRGRDYALEVTNNSPRRIGVLIAVDGLNVVNGERSALASHETMYVLGPFERTVIRGWRSSLAEVRRFVFVDEERSYAERTGQANGDMGWIRVLAFREDRPAWRWDAEDKVRTRELERGRDLDERATREPREERAPRAGAEPQRDAAPPPAAAAPEGRTLGEAKRQSAESFHSGPTAESFPGTGWGERRHDPVREVEFLAERRPVDRLVFRYEYASGLRALGIFPVRDRDRLRDRERGELGFARPPIR
jgi:hypothetical protein